MRQLIRIIDQGADYDVGRDRALAFAEQLVEQGEFDDCAVDSDRSQDCGQTLSLAGDAGRLAVRAALDTIGRITARPEEHQLIQSEG